MVDACYLAYQQHSKGEKEKKEKEEHRIGPSQRVARFRTASRPESGDITINHASAHDVLTVYVEHILTSNDDNDDTSNDKCRPSAHENRLSYRPPFNIPSNSASPQLSPHGSFLSSPATSRKSTVYGHSCPLFTPRIGPSYRYGRTRIRVLGIWRRMCRRGWWARWWRRSIRGRCSCWL